MKRNTLCALCLSLALVMLLSAASGAAAAGEMDAAVLPGSGETCVIYHPGVQAVRMGNIAGIHEVFFGTDTETITLKHEAHDRGVFADGAADAARFLTG